MSEIHDNHLDSLDADDKNINDLWARLDSLKIFITFESSDENVSMLLSAIDDVLSITRSILDKIKFRNLEKDRSFRITKKVTFELDLYKSKYFNEASYFPRVFSIIEDTKNQTVSYAFEKMSPLIGTGSLGGFFGSRHLFGPKIRTNCIDYLMLDASTALLHVLFGLHILHEHFEVIHGEISPSNIMFSSLDDSWKLNDFDCALPVLESLKTKRSVGTQNCIAPGLEFIPNLLTFMH